MNYNSSRGISKPVRASQAVTSGIAEDGGLYLPERLPRLTTDDLADLLSMNYAERSAFILKPFFDEFSLSELVEMTKAAYASGKFPLKNAAPVASVDANTFALELWHGPTAAFKDMALQILPYFMTECLKLQGESREACVLVATSGDTGKAALEGFCDVPGTRVIVFYPSEGVSEIQRMQMVSQKGKNVGVAAVRGNFDDAQTGVKAIFLNPECREVLSSKNMFFTSANSINWGRLAPQIVYYISAYLELVKKRVITQGDKINISVPTGNFGNILAAYYAREMGLPVSKIICASNSNNVLTDFLRSGVYDANREFYTTMSPSMDILISSNVERFIYHMTGGDAAAVGDMMEDLKKNGRYTLPQKAVDKIKGDFFAGFSTEKETAEEINRMYNEKGYLCDPHTAVAFKVLSDYRVKTGDKKPAIVASTASPYKFCDSVLTSLGQDGTGSPLELISRLSAYTKTTPPRPIAALSDAKVRFSDVVDKEEMFAIVKKFL